MFGNRCTLCGGKLDRRKICTECGLNNNQSEKHYKINQSSCDGEPLTHVHREESSERWKIPVMEREPQTQRQEGKQERKQKQTYSFQKTKAFQKKKGGLIKKAVVIGVVLSIASTIIQSLSDMELGEVFQNLSFDDSGYERSYPYERIEEEGIVLSDEGEEAEFELASGKYIVGVHIPAGYYEAETGTEYDVVEVDDWDHSIFLYERTGMEEENYLDDLRLFDGAVVTISAETPVVFRTENGQTIQYEENPLTNVCTFSGNRTVTAGKDFEAGAYDLEVLQGSGLITVTVYDPEEEEEGRLFTLYLGEGNTEGMQYQNLILPEQATMELMDDGLDEEFSISMSPSPQIVSTDYLQVYREYDYY